MSGRSVATYNDPEFLNITSVSPLMSKCDIKVLYLGGNRNGSFITKERAMSMAETLRGCPIAGHYVENKEDFGGHGQKLVVDDEGFHFEKQTRPYGFIDLNSKIWFQDFIDTDEFGNETQRTYLMVEGYLWTGQFPEVQQVIDEGRPQSMELHDATLKGHWSEDTKSGIEFFIIDDATFFQLCILGEDVEPCFEGAEVTNSTNNYSLDNGKDFTKTLAAMLKELKEYTLANNSEGGKTMPTPNEEVMVQNEEQVVETEFTAEAQVNAEGEAVTGSAETEVQTEEVANVAENSEENLDTNVENDFSKNENNIEGENSNIEEPVVETVSKEEYTLLEEKYNNLQSDYEALKSENETLSAYKAQIEDNEKLDLIQKEFSMLSEEDTKEILENRANYSLAEIKSQLAVIYFDKCNKEQEVKVEETKTEVPTTFSLDSISANISDPIAAALMSQRKSK